LILRALLQVMGDAVSVVGEARDGEEALAVVRRERPDIVVTDLVMPQLNGIELTRYIRTELPQTRIILISSHTDDAYRLMASDSGADSFVNKSVISTALVAAVRDAIARLDGEAFPHSPGQAGGGGYGG
jgi:DNA-binding NarL/FixJ family response regulator